MNISDKDSIYGVTWSSSNESIATVDEATGIVKGLKLGKVTITAKTSNGKSIITNITIVGKDLLSNEVQVGDYVVYDAGEWPETVATPTSQGQFGGYIEKQNKANSVTCYGSVVLKGWRVLSVDTSTNTVTIIHAGQPECYYHGTNSSASVTNLNNRATSEYLNEDYASSAHMMNKTEADAVSGNLKQIGVNYWLATIANSGSSYLKIVYVCGYDNSYQNASLGVRPVVVLKSNIRTTGKTTDEFGQEAWSLVPDTSS